MTREEFDSKLLAIRKKRDSYFSKINKCKKEEKKLKEKYLEGMIPYKVGDKFIDNTFSDELAENLKLSSIEMDEYDKDKVSLTFRRMTKGWNYRRGFWTDELYTTFYIDAKHEFKLPDNLEKVTD